MVVGDTPREPGLGADQPDDGGVLGAVQPTEVLPGCGVEAECTRSARDPGKERRGILCPRERGAGARPFRVEPTRRYTAQFVLEQCIHHLFAGGTRRRPLAAADRPEVGDTPVDVVVQLVATAGGVRVAAVALFAATDEGAQADRGGHDIVHCERSLPRVHRGVHGGEDRVNVVGIGHHRVRAVGERGVGGPDERAAHPRRDDDVLA